MEEVNFHTVGSLVASLQKLDPNRRIMLFDISKDGLLHDINIGPLGLPIHEVDAENIKDKSLVGTKVYGIGSITLETNPQNPTPSTQTKVTVYRTKDGSVMEINKNSTVKQITELLGTTDWDYLLS